MVVDFSHQCYPEKPVLVLENVDETPIQTLGYAFGVTGTFNFNEISTLEFDLPAYVEGVKTPHYDDVIGLRVINLMGWGRFILMKPKTSKDGVKEIKHCTAYSLEYEWADKKMGLTEDVYVFWSPLKPESSILGVMLSYLPDWTVGYVSTDLLSTYRNISADYKSVYDFAKNDVQVKYGCVFDFDTYKRVVNVYSTNDDVLTKSIFLSTQNLLHNIDVEEDTESIVTALDVNGAEGIDIRMVNPMGVNKIYNLDYLISTNMISEELASKWALWKESFAGQQNAFYALTLQYISKQSEKATLEMAQMDKRDGELATQKELLSVEMSYLLTLEEGSTEYIATQERIDDIKANITEINTAIAADQTLIDAATVALQSLDTQMKAIQQQTNFYYTDDQGMIHYNFGFTAEDISVLRRLFKEDSISESSFVASATKSYSNASTTLTNQSITVNVVTSEKNNEYAEQLLELSNAGNVDLLHRPLVQGQAMIDAGWTEEGLEPDDICTVFSSTFSTADEQTAMNFTPIQADIQGNLLQIISPDAFASYCEKVVDGVIDDYMKLKMGHTFTGETAINDAVEEAILIHDLHEEYFLDEENNKIYGYVTEVGGLTDKRLFAVDGGTLTLSGSVSGTTQIIRLIVELNSDNTGTVSGYLSQGQLLISGASTTFPSGCIMMRGTWSNLTTDVEGEGSDKTGYNLSFQIQSADFYMTTDTTAFTTYAVEYDLYWYGQNALAKLAWPSYSFSVDSANFLTLEDFVEFARQLQLGKRVYIDLGDKGILEPILVGASIEFDNPASLHLEFGSTFNLSGSSFALADLLEKGVSMGKRLDTNRVNYNAFVNSGASTSVRDYMTSALDVAKQTILSGGNIAVSWDSSGFWLRKRNSSGGYEDDQIGMINNSIVFTDDGWATAKMAIGKFYDKNLGEQWGIVAPSIVGTVLAGESLLIESTKSDGDVLAFRVDGNGASLHNADFSLYDNTAQGNHGRIDLGAMLGIVGGIDGTVPLFTYEQGVISGVATKNNNGVTTISELEAGDEPNANFWLDMNGDIWLRGTVYATDGEFTGIVKAKDYQLADGTSIWENGRFKGSALDLSGIGISASEPAADGTVTLSISLNNGQQSGGAHGLIQIDGNVDISGSLSADALYANYGDVADLTVDELSTTRRISLYLNRDTSDDNYISVRGQKLSFITGTTDGTVESALNPNGQKLYWEKDISGATIIDGWPFINGGTERVYLTTVQTLYPVSVYKYTELVKRSIEFEMDTEATDPSKRYYIPIDVFGAGTGDGKGRGYIIKKADGLHMEYEAENGKMCEIHWAMDGFLDFYGLRRTVALDCTAWPAAGETGQIVETLEGLDDPITYDVQLSEDEKTLTFIYADGVEFRVDLP